MSEPAVIAYPVESPNNRRTSSNNSYMDENVYASSLGDSKFADDTIEMSGNFFSQLDSMIAAVKVESSALDSMKEKLREVENLRNQISMFTKRLLDADQANLNLKSNLVKVQEMYAEAKKGKAEVESSVVPIRAELNRVKDQCNKERMGRLAAQQQLAGMKDQIAMLEQANENLDREVKTIPALAESNEILKNDLAQLRRRFKEEKTQMTKHIKQLENQARDVDTVKNVVRDLSMKLLDIANSGTNGTGSNLSTSSNVSINLGMPVVAGGQMSQQQQQQQQLQMQQRYQQAQQQARYGNAPPQQLQTAQQMPHHAYCANPQQSQGASNVYYQYGAPLQNNMNTAIVAESADEDDDNSYEDADEDISYEDETADLNVHQNEYENDGFVEVNSSIESVGSLVPKATAGKGSGGKKKKNVRRSGNNAGAAAQGVRTQPRAQGQPAQPRMMQQLDAPMSKSGNNNVNMMQGQYPSQQQQQQQQRNISAGNNVNNMIPNNGQGMSQSFSLPRI
eukprot:CAMPEP_0184986466 /NCGR_PEP_ID=MMETSP1098-20130426/16896_1 /TAXON_ID=89044 /ORGANISM="Spumella elongata, Strain CCAP 955/1" /LENGTH=507 /DNA_ID=CAMNT_0027510741 /DNA_START=164 /DNA_END=1687 /DNA_ORIENTATION=+